MNTFDIEAFFAIVDMGSISKASDFLSISQSALSRRILLLEKELGYKLFIRNKGIRQLLLTPRGKEFVPLAKKFQEVYGAAIALRSYKTRQALRVAAPDSLNSTILRSVYFAFKQQYPEITLSIQTSRSNESARAMEKGLLDLAYIGIRHTYKTIMYHSFFTEKVVFVCSKDSAYPVSIKTTELTMNKCLRLDFSPESSYWYKRNFVHPDTFFAYVGKFSMIDKELFSDNRWSLVPYYIAKEMLADLNLEIKQVDNPPADRKLYCVYSEHSPNHNLAKLFADFASKYLNDYFHIQSFPVSRHQRI